MTNAEIKEKYLSNDEIRKEYEALEPEFQLIRAILYERNKQSISQQELAFRTGINRSDISKIENGNANPSLKTLKRIADGLGKKLKIEFIS